MAIICNNEVVPEEKNILLDKWKFPSVDGECKPEKPPMCMFYNTARALQLLFKHIRNNNKIVLGTDVDVDGIGTTYILKKSLIYLGSNNHVILINQEKTHGIQENQVRFFNEKYKVDLVIITDSSSNELELIKALKCDVLVIDHHDILHEEYFGKCDDGVHDFVIVNNNVDNFQQSIDIEWLNKIKPGAFDNIREYKAEPDMSCGLVVYELMRVCFRAVGDERTIENSLLYQWAGVTLFTDVINTLNDRNQYYLNKTVFSRETERALGSILRAMNKFKATLDKSFITYSLAPIINKAIRAGKGAEAVDIVLNNPDNILELKKYADLQEIAIKKATTVEVIDSETGLRTLAPRVFTGKTIVMDVTKIGVHRNYNGVIAGRLSGDTHKDAAVYSVLENGICSGSFRGIYKDVNYRKYFADFSSDIYAQGHPPAFGFKCTKEQLDEIMNTLYTIEPTEDPRPWLTAGNIKPEARGIYHIDNMDEFRRAGYVWRIATGNSKVPSQDEINIRVSALDVKLKETKGKLFIYDALGFECKAFKPLSGSYFDIYLEYTNEITAYIR